MTLALVVGAFFGMEVLVYLSHRFVMHGPGMPIHKSHHQRRPEPTWERNDLYPLLGSALAMAGFGLGLNVGGLEALVPVAVGLTIYGAAYFFVHDIYIHRRLPWFGAELSVCERLKAAHRIHHLWGGEPYGMLFPVVPAALRERAAGVDYDPFPPSFVCRSMPWSTRSAHKVVEGRSGACEGIDAVPGAGRAVGAEAGEELLAEPTFAAGPAHHRLVR